MKKIIINIILVILTLFSFPGCSPLVFNVPDISGKRSSNANNTDDKGNDISSESNVDKVSIGLPETPLTVNYKTNTMGGDTHIYTKTVINSITEEKSDSGDVVLVKFIINCKKMFDYDGEDGTSSCCMVLRLKNEAGEIIHTEELYKLTVSVNQVFELEWQATFTPSKSYSIELHDKSI